MEILKVQNLCKTYGKGDAAKSVLHERGKTHNFPAAQHRLYLPVISTRF